LQAVPDTHSCNESKPWCLSCAKCAYVWLGYAAFLPEKLLQLTFSENPMNKKENLLWYQQLLGLTKHTPFECVGQADETRLLFELCRKRGIKGDAMTLYDNHFPNALDLNNYSHLLEPKLGHHCMPKNIALLIEALLKTKAQKAQAFVNLWL